MKYYKKYHIYKIFNEDLWGNFIASKKKNRVAHKLRHIFFKKYEQRLTWKRKEFIFRIDIINAVKKN